MLRARYTHRARRWGFEMNQEDLSPLWTLNNSWNFWTLYGKKTKTEPCDPLPSLVARRRNPREGTKEVNQGGSTIPRYFTSDSPFSSSPHTYFLSGNGDRWLSLVAARESCPAGRWALNFFSSGIRLYEACVAAEDTEGRNGGVTWAATALRTRPTFLLTDLLSPPSIRGLCSRAFPSVSSPPQPHTPCCPKPVWRQNATLIKSCQTGLEHRPWQLRVRDHVHKWMTRELREYQWHG